MLVSRLFVTHDDAMSAVDDLKQIGFGDARIRILTKAEDPIDATHVTSLGVSDPTRASQYAEGVSQGKTVVVVDAPLGATGVAKSILEQSRSADEPESATAYEEAFVRPQTAPTEVSSATPLSSWMKWPVLLDNPTPLSSYLNWRTLSPPPTAKPTSHGLPFLSDDPTPLSSKTGIQVLSDDPTPLSSRVGMKVLTDNPTPFSSWLGRQVLLDDPTPLSSRINMQVLLNNPTPLSSWLKLPVLSGDKTTKS